LQARHSAQRSPGMQRHWQIALLALVAVPAAAQALLGAAKTPCFAANGAVYQLSNFGTADYRVMITHADARADLKIVLVEDPAIADFVIADDEAQEDACRAATRIRTIAVDGHPPDLTVSLAIVGDTPDLRLYVHSARFSPEDAAALAAVMWRSARPLGVTFAR
jgi:hypothetical protein